MKSLMKLIVTILVVAVVGFTVGYLLMNGSKVKEDNPGSINSGEESSKSEEELYHNIEIIGGQSGEEKTNISGDKGEVNEIETKEEIISRINRQVQAINYNAVTNSTHVNLTEELVSTSAKEFMDYFKVKELSANVNVSEGRIEVIPDSDFIENMVYYFDGAGNLILFESVSTTVGGSCKYYFDNNVLVDIVIAYEEEFEVKTEKANDILSRAKMIYENNAK